LGGRSLLAGDSARGPAAGVPHRLQAGSYKEEKNLAHVELALVWANAPGMFTIGSIFMAAVPERRKAIF
jgi:hypothetical protein